MLCNDELVRVAVISDDEPLVRVAVIRDDELVRVAVIRAMMS